MVNKFDCGIYSITAPSGHSYIGSSKNIKKRWNLHKYHLSKQIHINQILQNAWNKYNGNLEFKQLLVCSPENLIFYEQLIIDSWKPEYNICKTAGSTKSIKLSPEHIEKIRQVNLGIKRSDEFKAKLRLAHLGKKKSPESIAKSIESNRNRVRKPHSEETKQKMKIAALKVWRARKLDNAVNC